MNAHLHYADHPLMRAIVRKMTIPGEFSPKEVFRFKGEHPALYAFITQVMSRETDARTMNGVYSRLTSIIAEGKSPDASRRARARLDYLQLVPPMTEIDPSSIRLPLEYDRFSVDDWVAIISVFCVSALTGTPMDRLENR